MRVFGWVVGALLFVVGVLSLVLAVSSFYALENDSSELSFFCTSDAGTSGIGTLDCRGNAGYGFQLRDLGAIGLYGVVGHRSLPTPALRRVHRRPARMARRPARMARRRTRPADRSVGLSGSGYPAAAAIASARTSSPSPSKSSPMTSGGSSRMTLP